MTCPVAELARLAALLVAAPLTKATYLLVDPVAKAFIAALFLHVGRRLANSIRSPASRPSWWLTSTGIVTSPFEVIVAAVMVGR